MSDYDTSSSSEELDQSNSSQTSDEYLRSSTTTRAGRVTRPRIVSGSVLSKLRTKNPKHRSTSRRIRKRKINIPIMAEQQNPIVGLTAEQFQQLIGNRNVGNANTTIYNAESLPTFRGRRRDGDPQFEESNSFADHISLLRSHFETLTNCTDADKKAMLVRSAHVHIGDFQNTVARVVNGTIYEDTSFDEVVEMLDDLYVDKDRRSINAVARDIQATVLKENEGLSVQMVNLYDKYTELAKHIVKDRTINVMERFPVQDDGTTDAEFRIICEKYLIDILVTGFCWLDAGPKMSDELHNKVLKTPFKHVNALVSATTKSIRELGTSKRALANQKRPQMPETRTLAFVAENETENETYFARSDKRYPNYSSHRGNLQSNFRGNYGDSNRGTHTRGVYRGNNAGNMPSTSTSRGTANRGTGTYGVGRGTYNPGQSDVRNNQSSNVSEGQNRSFMCFSCNEEGHLARNCYFICYNCKGKGHSAWQCRKPKTQNTPRGGNSNNRGGRSSNEANFVDTCLTGNPNFQEQL